VTRLTTRIAEVKASPYLGAGSGATVAGRLIRNMDWILRKADRLGSSLSVHDLKGREIIRRIFPSYSIAGYEGIGGTSFRPLEHLIHLVFWTLVDSFEGTVLEVSYIASNPDLHGIAQGILSEENALDSTEDPYSSPDFGLCHPCKERRQKLNDFSFYEGFRESPEILENILGHFL